VSQASDDFKPPEKWSKVSAAVYATAHQRFFQEVAHNGWLEYLGINQLIAMDHYYMPPEAARRIELLLTPNYKTIIKVWLIKQRQEVE
jgi:hypothetical protein